MKGKSTPFYKRCCGKKEAEEYALVNVKIVDISWLSDDKKSLSEFYKFMSNEAENEQFDIELINTLLEQ